MCIYIYIYIYTYTYLHTIYVYLYLGKLGLVSSPRTMNLGTEDGRIALRPRKRPRGKTCWILLLGANTDCEPWSVDPLGLRNVKLEVSDRLPDRLPQGPVRGSQAMEAELGSSGSSLPSISSRGEASRSTCETRQILGP